MSDRNSILREYAATANNPAYNGNWDVIDSKFPELKGYDKKTLREYAATANNPTYKGDWNVINAKFPELFGNANSSNYNSINTNTDAYLLPGVRKMTAKPTETPNPYLQKATDFVEKGTFKPTEEEIPEGITPLDENTKKVLKTRTQIMQDNMPDYSNSFSENPQIKLTNTKNNLEITGKQPDFNDRAKYNGFEHTIKKMGEIEAEKQDTERNLNNQMTDLLTLINDTKKNDTYDDVRTNSGLYRNNPGSLLPTKIADDKGVYYGELNYDLAEKLIKEAQDIKNFKSKNFIIDTGKGFWNSVSDIKTWDLGVSDIEDSGALLNASRKYNNGQKLSKREELLLEAAALNTYTKGMYAYSRGYKAGKVTGENIQFMMEFIVNPLSGSGSAIGKATGKFILKNMGKYAGKAVMSNIGKAALRVGGDVLASAAMTATSGLGRTLADTNARMTGDIQTDRNKLGDIEFAGTTNEKGLGKAFSEAFIAHTIDNYSEMLGEHFGTIGKGIFNMAGGQKLAKSSVGDLVRRMSNGNIVKGLRALEKRAKWNGVFGEYGEELSGTALNAIFVGDQKMSDLVDKDQQIDTFLGVALMGGFMSAVNTAGYGADRIKSANNLKKSTVKLQSEFDNWNDIHNDLTSMSFSERQDALKNVLRNPTLTVNQKKTIAEYTGALTYDESLKSASEKARNENRNESNNEGRETYLNSLGKPFDGTLFTLNKSVQDYEKKVGQEFADMTDEQIDEHIINNEQLTPEQIRELQNYTEIRQNFQGAVTAMREQAQAKIQPIHDEIDAVTHEDGTVISVQYLDENNQDLLGNVIDGKVVLNDDGSIDREQSDKTLVVKGTESDQPFTVSIKDVTGGKIENAEQAKQKAAEDINTQFEKELERLLDTDPSESEIAVGNQIQFTENGKPVLASVINRQGDVVELQDGNKVFRKTADELKEQMKKPDAINRGDEIPLQLNGELFVGKVTELPNADGKYTIHIASHPGQKNFYWTAEEINNVRLKEESQTENPDKTLENTPENADAAPSEEIKTSENTAYPTKKDGTIDYDAMTDEQLYHYNSEKNGDVIAMQGLANDYAKIQTLIAKKRKGIEKADSRTQIKLSEEIAPLQERADKISSLISKLNEEKAKQSQADFIAQKADKQAQRAEKYQPATGGNIQERWDNAEKIQGYEDTLTLPNGETINGRWIMADAYAVTPSHHPQTLQSSEGFPTVNGRNVNDNDYTTKRYEVEDKAQHYDGRAIDDPVVVKDGIVISGNNRTMSGQLAAVNGTDGKYLEALQVKAKKYGFTQEQTAQFEHPRVYFEVTEPVDFTTETFAKFNARTTKSKSATEKAIVASKLNIEEAVTKIIASIEHFETLDAFYNSEKAQTEVLKILTESGVINQNDVAELFQENKFTESGKDLLEAFVLGNILNETAIKQLNTMKGVRAKVVNAFIPLLENTKKEGQSLIPELNTAIDYLYQSDGNLLDFFAEQNLFEAKEYDLNAVTLAIALQRPEFRKFIQTTNTRLNGTVDMFLNRAWTKEDVYDEYRTKFNAEERAAYERASRANENERADTDGAGNIQQGRNEFAGTNSGTQPQSKSYETAGGNGQQSNEERKVDNNADGVRFHSISPIGFYSTVESALEKINQEKGTKEQFKAMLLKNGAKQAEMDWMGFDELPEKLTKADIQNWIDENRIEVKEVEKETVSRVTESDIKNVSVNQFGAGYWVVKFKNNVADTMEIPLSEASNEKGAIEYALTQLNYDSYDKQQNAPKFSQYVLPGGENYKELLLTMPAKRYGLSDEGIAKRELNTFRSSHFDEPNILAHVRFNERTVNGERVLFIEEFQSDWAQSGREKGFKGFPTDLYNEVVKNGMNPEQAKRDIRKLVEQPLSTEERPTGDEWRRLGDFSEMDLNEIFHDRRTDGVPSMPFKKTDQWVNLAARRMIRYAAENGFDRIAWTTGEQQADRYDLSKQVKSVEYYSYNQRLIVHGNDKLYLVDETGLPENKIEDYIGKEAARKLLNSVEEEREGHKKYKIEGDGLKVGGEGMRGFYNNIIPSLAAKLGKPFNAKIEEIELPEIGKQQSIPITDSMEKSVIESGVPLFQSDNKSSGKFRTTTLKKLQKVVNLLKKNGLAKDVVMDERFWDRLADLTGDETFRYYYLHNANRDRWDNSGYTEREDGTKVSVRALEAENEGTYSEGNFRKTYGVSKSDFNLLVALGLIKNTEWHHTGKSFKETEFYSWSDSIRADGEVDYSNENGDWQGEETKKSLAQKYFDNKKQITKLSKEFETKAWEYKTEKKPTPVETFEQFAYNQTKQNQSLTDKEQNERANRHEHISTVMADNGMPSYERRLEHESVDEEYKTILNDRIKANIEENKAELQQKYDEKYGETIRENETIEKYNAELFVENAKTNGKEKILLDIAEKLGIPAEKALDKVKKISGEKQQEIADKQLQSEKEKHNTGVKQRAEIAEKAVSQWVEDNIAEGKIVQRTRVSTRPPYFITTLTEMNGKYGWFNSAGKHYNMPEYYSGLEFANKELYDEYRNKQKEIGDILSEVRYLKRPDGTIYGFVDKNNVVYLNPDEVNLNTPIHEFGHLWVSHIQKDFPDLYARAKEVFADSVYMEQVQNDPNYAHLTPEQQLDEAIARAIGDKGESELNKTTLQKIKEWIAEVWERIGAAFGVQNLTPEQISKLTWEDITEIGVSELLSGSPLNAAVRGKEQAVSNKGQSESEYKQQIAEIKANAIMDGTFMKAPNGEPTHLNERQWLQVRTPEFKAWFGDWEKDPENASKVVDENGEPMVVYHGTRESFFAFDEDLIGSRWSFDEKGFFFTSSIKFANDYADNTTYGIKEIDKGVVMHVFINSKKPFIINNEFAVKEGFGKVFDREDSISFWDNYQTYILDEIDDRQSDGVIIDDGLHKTVVAFSPTQIKSATDNVGTYDSENADIRYQIIGEQGAEALDKQEEATTRLDNLRVAKEMETAGKDAKTIRLATGWERGADSKWRYEILDGEIKKDALKELEKNQFLSNKDVNIGLVIYRKNDNGTYELSMMEKGAKNTNQVVLYSNLSEPELVSIIDNKEVSDKVLSGEGSESIIGTNLDDAKEIKTDFTTFITGASPLNEVFESKELFTAYPELKDVVVVVDKNKGLGASYSIRDGQKVITIGNVTNRTKSTLIHEIQHAIQDIEGFAKGGNLLTGIEISAAQRLGFEDYASYRSEVNRQTEEINKMEKEYEVLSNKSILNIKAGIKSAKLEYQLEEKRNELKKLRTTQEDLQNQFENYKRLAGEVEARNVQTRMGMTPEERREKLLSETEDVAREDQVVIMNYAGESEMAAGIIDDFSEKIKKDGIQSVIPQYNDFLNNVMNGSSDKASIIENAKNKGWNLQKSIEDYLASFAEKGVMPDEFERIVKLAGLDELTPSEIKTAFWLQANPDDGSIMWKAKYAEAKRKTDDTVLFHTNEVPLIGALEEYERQIGNKKKKKIGFEIEEAYFDYNASIRRLQNIISKGKPIADNENAYMAMEQQSSIAGKAIDAYLDGLFKDTMKEVSETDNVLKKSKDTNLLSKELKAEKQTLNRVTIYALAKSGLGRNERLAKEEAKKAFEESHKALDEKHIKGEIDLIEYATLKNELNDKEQAKYEELQNKDYAGLTALSELMGAENWKENAENIVSEAENILGEDTANALWNKIKEATSYALTYQYERGMMTKEQYEHVLNLEPYYLPLRGYDEETAPDLYTYLTGKQGDFNPLLVKAKGHTHLAENPFAHIASMTASSVIQAEKNKAKNYLLRFIENNNNDVFSIKDTWVQNIGTKENPEWVEMHPNIEENASPEEVAQSLQDFDNKMKTLQAEGTAMPKRNALSLKLPIGKGNASEHAIKVFRNGEELTIYVNGNPRVAQAVNGLLNPNANKMKTGIGEFVAKINRFRSANFTSRNPEFSVTNTFRDINMALTLATVEEGLGYSLSVTKHLVDAQRTLASHFFGSDTKGNYKKYLDEFFKHGGATGYVRIYNIDKYQKDIRKLQRDLAGKNIGQKALALPKYLIHSIENFNDMGETITRFAVYIASRESGRSEIRSANDAKNITLNFNRQGSGAYGAKYFRNWILFFNPAMQALYRLNQTRQRNPAGFYTTLGLYAAAGYFIPTLMGMFIQLLLGDDDKEKYYQIPEWVRRANLIIPLGNGKFAKYPLGQEMRWAYGIGEMIRTYQDGKDEKHSNKFLDYGRMVSQILPIDPLGDSHWFLPGMGAPVAEAYFLNENFMGKPIYKERKFAGQENEPDWTLAFKNNWEFLNKTTKEINELTGGDDYSKGWLNLNPARIQHLTEGYFGGALSFYVNAAETFKTAFSDKAADVNKIPVARRVFTIPEGEMTDQSVGREYMHEKAYLDNINNVLSDYKKKELVPYVQKVNNGTEVTPEETKRYNEYSKKYSRIEESKDYLKAVYLKEFDKFISGNKFYSGNASRELKEMFLNDLSRIDKSDLDKMRPSLQLLITNKSDLLKSVSKELKKMDKKGEPYDKEEVGKKILELLKQIDEGKLPTINSEEEESPE